MLALIGCKNTADNYPQNDSTQQENTDANSQEFQEIAVANINPTGTYKLDSKTEKIDGEVYGYTGNIQVKMIKNDLIVMTFEVNKGAPSYNMGAFVDTLSYKNNIAIYTAPEDIDSTCNISFKFDNKGVTVVEKTENYNTGCGFGYAVVADGFYKRTSSKVPKLIEPLTGDPID